MTETTKRTIIPTRSCGVLDIGRGITLFKNVSLITYGCDDSNLNHDFFINRIENVQYVRVQRGYSEGEDAVYKSLNVYFIDRDYVECLSCAINVPLQWLPRTFLLFLMRSIMERAPPIISVMIQRRQGQIGTPDDVDINSILAGYAPLSIEDQLELADYSEYQHRVRGGIH